MCWCGVRDTQRAAIIIGRDIRRLLHGKGIPMLTLAANMVLALEDVLLDLEDTVKCLDTDRDGMDLYLLDMAFIECGEAISALGELILVEEALGQQ
jgi:hypothetical protein